MGMRYYFYIGVQEEDGKISPLAPFTSDGQIYPIASYDPMSWDCFDNTYNLSIDQMSDRFKEVFWGYNKATGEYAKSIDDYIGDEGYVTYIPIKNFILNYTSIFPFLKTGYFEKREYEAVLKDFEKELPPNSFMRFLYEGVMCLTEYEYKKLCDENPEMADKYVYATWPYLCGPDYVRYEIFLAIRKLVPDYPDTHGKKYVVIMMLE